jgi:signal transduction histidine kinase
LTGLSLGFALWTYTLLLPSLARSGWLPVEIIDQGPLGIALLKPYALFGLDGLDHLSHALFWSMLANIGGFIAVSLMSQQTMLERIQAVQFVDAMRQAVPVGGGSSWQGTASFADLRDLVVRFIGRDTADRAFAAYASGRGEALTTSGQVGADLVDYTERLLAGAIGAASARVMVASVVKGEMLGIDRMLEILDEASQVIEYSHRLEQKSRELEAATAELRAANEQLTQLDRLKDDFLSTVSHELRTPLTSIRSFSEILYDHADMALTRRQEFLGIIIKESERLTRLINQLLDYAKMESGQMEWLMDDLDSKAVIEDALAASRVLFEERSIRLDVRLPDDLGPVYADHDRLIQVIVNLLSNAAKFCDPKDGRVTVAAENSAGGVRVSVVDNGPGVPGHEQEAIFERFHQVSESGAGRPQGTGLGLPICRQIVEHFGGRIWIESVPGAGATFRLLVPSRRPVPSVRAAQ